MRTDFESENKLKVCEKRKIENSFENNTKQY